MKGRLKTILAAAEASCGVQMHEYANIPSASLFFSPELLILCESNACGSYNRCWTCPPAAETQKEQMGKILQYRNVFVFTTKHDLEDSFDHEGMTRGGERHAVLTLEFRDMMPDTFLFYGAGNCPYCRIKTQSRSCTFPNPCTFPGEKLGSIEAAGINVTELSKTAGLTYNNGPNTVTYFSMVLWEKQGAEHG